jgi:hypothetical protein
LQNSQFKFTQGYVLIDFPHTYEQAKLLEKTLTGWMPADEIPLTEFESKIETLKLVVRPSETLIL